MAKAVNKDTSPQPNYRSIFEGVPGLYLVLDPSLKIVAVSDAYCRATMTVRENIQGRGIFEVFPDNPDDPAATGVSNLRSSLERVLALRQPDAMAVQKYDVRSDADGGVFEERYWSPLNTPVLDAAGAVMWIIHRVEDVTGLVRSRAEEKAWDMLERERVRTIAQLRERTEDLARANEALSEALGDHQRAEEELVRTRIFLDLVVENIPAMLFVKDAKDYRFVLLNRAGEELLGYDRKELIGKSDYDFFPKDEADLFIARDKEVLSSGRLHTIAEESVTTRHKGIRTLHTKKMPMLDPDGRPAYLLGLSEDITDRKTSERQLQQSQKMDAIGQLTGGVAHDFNNLLTVILSNADSLAEALVGDDDLRSLAEMTRMAAERGAELTNSLLAFARRQALEPRSVDVNRLVAGMDGLLRRSLGEEIEIERVQGAGLWQATVDPVQLETALLNLALNARDAMPRGGRLTIETGNSHIDLNYSEAHDEVTPGQYVLLCVSDTGTGMSPDVIARAFDPFFSTKEVGKGTGLGLSMVYGFVKQSGGHIKIYSEVGHGTAFKIYLPRSGEVEAAPEPSRARKNDPTGSETILAVEDDDLVRAHAERVLRSLGYNVLIASNGPQALNVLKSDTPIDLLFTDVVMPGGLGGRQLAEQASALRPGLKVLFTSGYTENAIVHHGRLDPGVHLIRKPYRKAELALKLRQLLDPGPSARPKPR